MHSVPTTWRGRSACSWAFKGKHWCRVSLVIHNFNTTFQISLTIVHLWYNPGPTLLSPIIHYFSWSTIANCLCFACGSTYNKRPQLLMAYYSNCLPCLSHIPYHSAWLALLWLPARCRKLMYQSTWHHSPEDWKLNAICSKHLHCHLLGPSLPIKQYQ
jgi:hypothetical protein